MKKFAYFTALTLLVCSICACGGKENTNSNADTSVSTENFSTEMYIEDATEATIVEMP